MIEKSISSPSKNIKVYDKSKDLSLKHYKYDVINHLRRWNFIRSFVMLGYARHVTMNTYDSQKYI